MNKQLNCIMLIDDNKFDNLFHERVIRRNNAAKIIVLMSSAREALNYITNERNQQPDIIFLDINMPDMDGWDFLDQYKKISSQLRSRIEVIMLTTSENPDDIERARNGGILKDFKSKPLTTDMLKELIH